jgi:hypothetical protein
LKSECANISEVLSEYLDGVLDPLKMSAVTRHLQICADCNREYESLKSVVNALGNIGSIQAPIDFLENLHERIRRNDTLFDRIRKIFTFTGFRFPVEFAGVAATALLVLFLFNFFPAEEKSTFTNIADNKSQSALKENLSPTQFTESMNPPVQTLKRSDPATGVQKERIPVNLALSLITVRDSKPIPSQSVSFGNSSSGIMGNESDPFSNDDESTVKIGPDEMNSKIDEIVKSSDGKIISRDLSADTGYTSHLSIDIPGVNYRRFISKIESIGLLKNSAPDLPEGSKEADVLIQMELTTLE